MFEQLFGPGFEGVESWMLECFRAEKETVKTVPGEPESVEDLVVPGNNQRILPEPGFVVFRGADQITGYLDIKDFEHLGHEAGATSVHASDNIKLFRHVVRVAERHRWNARVYRQTPGFPTV